MTSRCLDLRDHVTTKSISQMEMQSFLAPAHAAAFMFIDAIDPVGLLNSPVYQRIGSIFSKLARYEKFLGGTLAADVAIYVSSDSRFDYRENGLEVGKAAHRSDNMAAVFAGSHVTAVMGSAQSLQEAHIPYAVVTQRNLGQLGKYRAIILPNVLVMSDLEIKAFRDYVAAGGALYASGYSSLVSETGEVRKDFGLADVFGASARERMDYSLSFFMPSVRWLNRSILPQGQMIHRSGWIHIQNRTAKVLAELAKPWYPENEGTVLNPSFSSIHSTPPSIEPYAPGITWHRYGKGCACYAAGPLEAENQKISRDVHVELIRRLLGRPVSVEADAPAFVEITAFDKAAEKRINISLVSLRQIEEPIPCSGTVRVRLGKDRRFAALRSLPGRKRVPVRPIPGGIEFAFRDFEIFSMFELEYRTL
jgi:hypothetical protein